MTTQPVLRLLWLSLFLTFGATVLHAASGDPYTEIKIPDGLSKEGTQAAIIKAAIGRRWNIIEKENDKVVIHLKHRGWDSTLTFRIEAKDLLVYSDSWTTNKKGDRKKKKDPSGWIENLEKDIIVFMNRELYG